MSGAAAWLALTVATFSTLAWYTQISYLIMALLALNISAFTLYGLDKLLAVNHARRIPERVLYLAAFIGGAAGALAGMYVFHHKVSKTSFQFTLAVIILLEILLILQYARTVDAI